MSAFTNYLEDALLDHILRVVGGGSAYSRPATIYLGLFTQATTDGLTSGGGDGGAPYEVTTLGGSLYARQAVEFSDPSATPGQVSNVSDITFPTAGASWGTITHFALFDSGTYGAGNALYHAALATPKTVDSGDTFQVLTGQLIVGHD